MKNMKKLTCLALAGTMSLTLLSGCGGGSATTPAPAPQDSTAPVETTAPVEKSFDEMTIDELKPLIQTVNSGKLTVATSPDFAPYEFYAIAEDGTPTLAGFDVALAGYIADYLGLELDIIPMDFDGVIMEVGMNNVDMGMAGLSPDPKRANQMDFSDLYYTGGQSLVCLKENADKFDSFEKANNPEVTIGAQIGSIQVDLAQENTPNATIIQLAKVTDIIAEMLSGKMDMGYIETEVALSYQKQYPDLELVLDVPYDQAGSAIGVTKGNEALLAGVNLAIAQVLSDGTMEDFVAQANELSSGEKYEGLLDADGQVQG